MTLVLASGSPRRKEILRKLGLDFEVVPSLIEENLNEFTSPVEAVITLASAKAHDVADRLSPKISRPVILAGDTIVVLDDKLLGQPKSKQEAKEMLTMLSGRTHQVYTGVVAFLPQQQREITGHEVSNIHFVKLGASEINAYVETNEGMDKAGAWALQGIGAALVEKIDGCFSNVIGFPVPLVVRILRQCGFTILGLP